MSKGVGAVAGETVAGVRFGFWHACGWWRDGRGGNSLCRSWLDRRRAGDRDLLRRQVAWSGVDWLGTAERSGRGCSIGGCSVDSKVAGWRTGGLISGSGLGYGDRVVGAEGRLRYWECCWCLCWRWSSRRSGRCQRDGGSRIAFGNWGCALG